MLLPERARVAERHRLATRGGAAARVFQPPSGARTRATAGGDEGREGQEKVTRMQTAKKKYRELLLVVVFFIGGGVD